MPYGKRLGFRPSRIPLVELDWPLGEPDGIEGQTLGDLLPTDHLIMTPHSAMYYRPRFGLRAQVSVLIMEPRAVHHKHMKRIEMFRWRFHRVLTSDRALLDSLPNALFFLTVGSWVPNWREVDLSKSEMCSLIASGKTKQLGHKLRHEVVQWVRDTDQDISVMGKGYQPFDEKSDGLAPFRYSVVIENAREENNFSEKLIDALLCNTVPIYWGCPNIDTYLDTRGMIITQSFSEIQRAVEQMSEADYAARVQQLAPAREAAAGYGDIYRRAATALLEAG